MKRSLFAVLILIAAPALLSLAVAFGAFHAASAQALRHGTSYDPWPSRPDPYAYMMASWGWPPDKDIIAWRLPDEVPPAQRKDYEFQVDNKLEELGVDRETFFRRVAYLRNLYEQRHGRGSLWPAPGVPAVRPCGSEREQNTWSWVLRGACLGEWRESGQSVGWDCIATPREIDDATWQCPSWLECRAGVVLGRPGYTEENRAWACRADKPEEWTDKSKSGCTLYYRQSRPGCSKVDPEPPTPPEPPVGECEELTVAPADAEVIVRRVASTAGVPAPRGDHSAAVSRAWSVARCVSPPEDDGGCDYRRPSAREIRAYLRNQVIPSGRLSAVEVLTVQLYAAMPDGWVESTWWAAKDARRGCSP